jgi:polar amino acid transport system permease protein
VSGMTKAAASAASAPGGADGQGALDGAPTRARRAAFAWLDLLVFAVVVVLSVLLVLKGASSMDYKWQWSRLTPYLVRQVGGEWVPGALLKGLRVTLEISAMAIVIALPIGLATAMLNLSKSPVGILLARVYVEVIRNTPILLQVLIFYFIVARVVGIERWWAGVLTLALYEGAFAAEIIRGGIVAVSRGQWEAGMSLALTRFDLYRSIILPQALPLMLPPLTGVLVNLVKHSSIVSVIAIFDLTNEGRSIAADTFMSFEVWLAVAALYLAVTISLSLAAAWLENRISRRASA